MATGSRRLGRGSVRPGIPWRVPRGRVASPVLPLGGLLAPLLYAGLGAGLGLWGGPLPAGEPLEPLEVPAEEPQQEDRPKAVSPGSGERKGGGAGQGGPVLPSSGGDSSAKDSGQATRPSPQGGGRDWGVPEEEGGGGAGSAEGAASKESAEGPSGAGVAEPSPRLKKVLDQARVEAKKFRKEPERLVALLQAVVDEEPDNAEARYRLALASSRAGDLKGCLGQLERALVLAPGNPRYLSDLGVALGRAGEVRKGLEHALRALQMEPANPRFQNAVGGLFLAQGDVARAVVSFQEAVRGAPNNAGYIHNLGRAYLNGGQPDLAVQAFTEALRLNPQSARAYNDRGLAHKELKQIPKAAADFEAAVRLDPEFPLVHHNLAVLYANESDPEFTFRLRAVEHGKKAVDLSGGKNPEYLMGLAEALKVNRLYEQALAVARQAVALDPSEENLKRMKAYRELVEKGFTGRVRSVKDDKELGLGVEIKDAGGKK